ncbi:MAG TPA: alkaline phosphatase D family protein [Cyclobacteriaceae bacterium]
MRHSFTLLFASLISFSILSQSLSPTSGINMTRVDRTYRTNQELPFDASLEPFFHGVASGDPLSDRVIIWTRVTPGDDFTGSDIEVEWFVATDPGMSDIVSSGTFTTNAERDYTVKVDVEGLNAATTYYYAFSALEGNSLIGRTRTTPTAAADQLRFAVVSCSNLQHGYFNGFGRIADREDLDAVIHLGDYIYEYGTGPGTYGFDSSRLDRSHIPDTEILALADYRTRYSLYRLDADLRRAHQQHPFIAVWDDHESANDAYKDGAENHNDGEGDWETRKAISRQVYFEWMPIRESEDASIYRTISYGDLADLIMLDTRIEGREEQILDITNEALYAPTRTLLGQEQKTWFFNELRNSTAKWKVIGNQVIFSEFHVGWAADPNLGQTFESVESDFLDIWDGYPFERNSIIDSIALNQIDNVIILTGDFHSTFAFDVAKFPSIFSLSDPLYLADPLADTGLPGYDPASQTGSFAVEFATPSITSANFDENFTLILGGDEVLAAQTTAFLELQINTPLADTIPGVGGFIPNPHMKFNDLDRHGYFLLDLKEGQAQADWYYVDILNPDDDSETFAQGWFTEDGANRLTQNLSASAEKTSAPDLAPDEPFEGVVTSVGEPENVSVFSIYPNPVTSGTTSFIQFGLLENSNLEISLLSIDGRLIKKEFQGDRFKGNYNLAFDIPVVDPGLYLLNFKTNNKTTSRKIVIK